MTHKILDYAWHDQSCPRYPTYADWYLKQNKIPPCDCGYEQAVKNLPEVHSVKDQLPPVDRNILVYDTEPIGKSKLPFGWRVMFYHSNIINNYHHVTHWCELPDDPT